MAAPDPSVRKRVEDRLRELLAVGDLLPGSSVPIAALARRWGVSETPIREAGWRAVGEGWLVPEPRGGFRIWGPDIDELTDTYQAFELLLIAAVGLINLTTKTAESFQPQRHSTVLDGINAMQLLLEEAGNSMLIAMTNRVIDRLAPFQRAEIALLDDVAAEHAALSSAVLGGSRALMRDLVRRYCRRRRVIAPATIGLVDEWRRLGPPVKA